MIKSVHHVGFLVSKIYNIIAYHTDSHMLFCGVDTKVFHCIISINYELIPFFSPTVLYQT